MESGVTWFKKKKEKKNPFLLCIVHFLHIYYFSYKKKKFYLTISIFHIVCMCSVI